MRREEDRDQEVWDQEVSYAFGSRSIARLQTCHPLLQTLMQRVIKRGDLPFDLTILCGHRNQADQDAAFRGGASKLRWPNSKHNSMPSRAVDLAPWVGGQVSWDWTHYNKLAPLIKDEWGKMVAEGLTGDTKLAWGGDWRNFPDGPHWQLS